MSTQKGGEDKRGPSGPSPHKALPEPQQWSARPNHCLVVELDAAPVAAGVVPLVVAGTGHHALPVGDLLVGLELLAVLLLDGERAETSHGLVVLFKEDK